MDLSKLKALEMPSEIIEVEICGEKQPVKVFAPDDVVAAKICGIGTDPRRDSADVNLDISRLVLTTCVPELSEEDVDLLLKKALSSAVLPIVAKARDLRAKHQEAIKAEQESAEKNLPKADSVAARN